MIQSSKSESTRLKGKGTFDPTKSWCLMDKENLQIGVPRKDEVRGIMALMPLCQKDLKPSLGLRSFFNSCCLINELSLPVLPYGNIRNKGG